MVPWPEDELKRFPLDYFGPVQTHGFVFGDQAQGAQGNVVHIPRTELGRGVFGTVRPARMRTCNDDTMVAKTFERHPNSDDRAAAVCNEYNISCMLKHENIVACFGAMLSTVSPVLYFERVDGTNLAQHFTHETSGGRYYCEDKLRRIFTNLLEAFHYLQTARIVHLDLKAQNVMIKTNGPAKLIDFGCARSFAEGKPMVIRPDMHTHPPEINLESMGGVDQKADIFFCGSLLYSLATKDFYPFGMVHGMTVEKQDIQLRGKVKKRYIGYSRLSQELKTLIDDMTAYDPRQRPDAAYCLQNPWFMRSPRYQEPDLRNHQDRQYPRTAAELDDALLTQMAQCLQVSKCGLTGIILRNRASWEAIAYQANLHRKNNPIAAASASAASSPAASTSAASASLAPRR
ncbi:sperm motility kinase 2B-like isoform X1 [Sycon ciliatum]|uniref:sperm motility kinase 2B-like isoform X1 n=2 Tax=Sycon ciliatum TaxID=27933 RepID=UPI0031F5F470